MANIKYTECDQVKPLTAFSETQITKLNLHKSKNKNFNSATTAYIRCWECTPRQVTELKCHWCDITKGKDKFSDKQCTKGEYAVCKKCSNEIKQIEPRANSDEDEGSGSDTQSDDDDQEAGTRFEGESTEA